MENSKKTPEPTGAVATASKPVDEAEAKKNDLKKKRVRYLAVDTVNSKETSPQAKKSVMIWDTQSEQVVGSKVYDVKTPPETGQTGQFNTYTADYIAMGNS